MNTYLKTKFGVAQIDSKGYYRITSGKEGNNNKFLHRLIFESFYGFKIPKNYIIHHKNGNKTDNCILNLQLMHISLHGKLHNIGKKLSEKTKEKISNSRKGKTLSEKTKKKVATNHARYWKGKNRSKKTIEKISKKQTTTGILRVCKDKQKNCKQGFIWCYQYKESRNKNIKIVSVNLLKLKEKVLEKGLNWVIVDKEKAKMTCERYNYNFEEVSEEIGLE